MNRIVRLFGGTSLIFVALVTAPSASAASGWYLLVPPSSDFNERAEYLQGYKILDTKPLSQWWQQGAYDSASECEAVKNTLLMTEHSFYSKSSEDYIKAVGANKDSAVLKHMRWTSEKANANVDAWTASRCIKSDDPRLGK
jgi:hypothetical protein